MITQIVSEPSIEPITVAEAKTHCRIDAGDVADNITSNQSIAPGSHAVAADYSLVGSSVDVSSGGEILVTLIAGDCSGGTVDVKIQDSDDDTNWTDWSGGSFTQVDSANDEATFEKQYTGGKDYVRVVATVGTGACSFGVNVLVEEPYSYEDTYLTTLIKVARRQVEKRLNRKLITQTWDMWIDKWPEEDFIQLAFGDAQSITSVSYTDSDGDSTTLTADTDYVADTDSEPARVVLEYGESWPTATLHPKNPIKIRFVTGYGDNRSDVPENVRHAVKFIVGDLYEFRETMITGTILSRLDDVLDALLVDETVWRTQEL